MQLSRYLTRLLGTARPMAGAASIAGIQREIEQARHIFEASPDLILITDTQGNIVRVSPSCETILGYRPEEMAGRSAISFIHPDDLNPTREQMRTARRREEALIFEARYRHKDGRVVTLEWTAAWSREARLHYFFGRDMTAQKRNEETIREYAEREQLFIAAVESSNDAIVTKNLDGIITGWNAAAEHLFGYRAEEVVGKSIYLTVPEELRGDVHMILAKIKAGEKIEHHETTRITKDGRLIDVSLSVSPVKSRSGAIVGAAKVARDISASKRAQAALVESEQMARAIIDTALDAFLQLDEAGMLLDWSPKAEAMFGWSREEVVGRNLRDFVVPPEGRAANAERLADFLAGARRGITGLRYEASTLRRDGKRIDTEISITALQRGGRYIINGFIRDITDRVQAEKDRDYNRELLDRALNNMRHGLLMFDSSNSALVINRTYVDMYGLPPELAKPPITVRDLLALRKANGTFSGDIDGYIEDHFIKARGVDRAMDIPDGRTIRVVNRFMDDGGWVSVHEDVTERVRAQQERDRNREFLDRIIDNITVAVLVKDARDLRYVLVNKSAERLWGVPREQIIGKTAREIFPPATADVIEDNDRQLLKSKSNFFVADHTVQSPNNGTRLVTSNRLAIYDQKGEVQYILGVVDDVTDRRAVENQLRQAQKMESIGQMTGGIAHDFNNMLTVITGTIDFLAEGVKDQPELAAIAKLISEAADRGAELTGHLLSFARKQPLQPREIDVNALMVETEKLMRRSIGEQIDIELRLEEKAWPALVDPTQLTMALLNLAVNSRDAMPDGGKLTLETGNAVLDRVYVGNNLDVRPGSYLMIAVSDTGSGMPEAVRQRVFEPFFTTKQAGKGTGLGLSMVYGFVKQSNGHIQVYSEEGYGTTFKIYLPRGAAAPEAVDVVPEAAPAGGGETILVVEDDPLVRGSVITQLQSLGYRTLTAATAAEALAIADTGEPFDLLFTDVIMPGGMNGRQLAEEMARRRGPLPVLFTSGYTENAIIHHGRLDPGVHLLAKPYRKADLAGMVRRAIDGAETFAAPADKAPAKRQAV